MRSRRMLVFASVMALVLGTSFAIAWILRPDGAAGPCAVVNGPAMLPEYSRHRHVLSRLVPAPVRP
jgi:hypothetical protein